MLYLKKYLTEGLIQMALLLSLCGVLVDVGLEPYLPPAWQEMILGPSSALTQTQFHNLRNRLQDGQDLHPKSVDLDGFFTSRRLLGFVRSLDRLQVPQAELETWLVQRESDPLPVECPDQRNRPAAPVDPRPPVFTLRDEEDEEGEEEEEEDEDEEDEEEDEEETHHDLRHRRALDERGQEEEEEDHLMRQHRRTAAAGGGSYSCASREQTQGEVNQTSVSFAECLRLLEDTFPFTEDPQLHDDGSRGRHQENQPQRRERLPPPIIPTGNPSADLEQDWQDLLALMEPESADVDETLFDHNQNWRPTENLQGLGSEALNPNCVNQEADQDIRTESSLPQGLLGHPHQLQQEPALLSLTPSAELDDHTSPVNIRGTSENPNGGPFPRAPHHTDLLSEYPSEDFNLGLNAEDNLSTFSLNLLPQDLVAPYPETPSSFGSSPERMRNGVTEDVHASPSSAFLFDEEDNIDEDDLLSPLGELLEDTSILEDIRLLDIALEEGFSPEMAARLEENGYLDREDGDYDHSGSSMAITEDQDQDRPTRHQEGEADSDSGLSLDFSHSPSPASPCSSEASSYSSSSSSSSSCVSAVGSPLSDNSDDEEGSIGSEMEVEVAIKQEELEEEEMGAVGGENPADDMKPFAPYFGDQKMFNGFPWLEQIGHDHTYNQPWPSPSSPSLGKMSTKNSKSIQRHGNSKPYHCPTSRHVSDTKMWSRDERRAVALKVPFSIDLIVNLPVEDFNDLLAKYHLSEEQLTLVRDIRRRGKNKIAAQNCRKRKLDAVLGLKDDVSGLRRYRSRLLREKQEALRHLQEMKRQLESLYQEVFSRLRDDSGRPLDAMEYLLQFESNGDVSVASRQQGAGRPLTKHSKKQRDKKK